MAAKKKKKPAAAVGPRSKKSFPLENKPKMPADNKTPKAPKMTDEMMDGKPMKKSLPFGGGKKRTKKKK